MKNNWPVKKLGEIATIQKGKMMSNFDICEKGSHPYIVIDDLRNGQYSRYTMEDDGVKCVTEDSLIVWDGANAGTVGGGLSGYVGSTIAKISPNKDIDSLLLKYLLQSKFPDFNQQTHGGAIPHLNREFVFNLDIPIPPIEIQKKIVERLDAIEKAQELNDLQIFKTDELFESVIQKIFDNKVSIVKLSELCDVRDGTHDSPKYQQQGTPLITSKNLKNDSIDFSDVKYISAKDRDRINQRSKVDQGDIIFGMIGTIGNPAIIGENTDFCIKNVALIKFPKKETSNEYIFYFLKSSIACSYLLNQSRGGTQKFVSLKNIRDMQVPNLPLSEQQKIVTKLSAIQDYKKLLLKQKELLQELFNSVLYKSMNGDLD